MKHQLVKFEVSFVFSFWFRFAHIRHGSFTFFPTTQKAIHKQRNENTKTRKNSSTVGPNLTNSVNDIKKKWRPTFVSVHFYKNFIRVTNKTRCFVLFTALIMWTITILNGGKETTCWIVKVGDNDTNTKCLGNQIDNRKVFKTNWY